MAAFMVFLHKAAEASYLFIREPLVLEERIVFGAPVERFLVNNVRAFLGASS